MARHERRQGHEDDDDHHYHFKERKRKRFVFKNRQRSNTRILLNSFLCYIYILLYTETVFAFHIRSSLISRRKSAFWLSTKVSAKAPLVLFSTDRPADDESLPKDSILNQLSLSSGGYDAAMAASWYELNLGTLVQKAFALFFVGSIFQLLSAGFFRLAEQSWETSIDRIGVVCTEAIYIFSVTSGIVNLIGCFLFLYYFRPDRLLKSCFYDGGLSRLAKLPDNDTGPFQEARLFYKRHFGTGTLIACNLQFIGQLVLLAGSIFQLIYYYRYPELLLDFSDSEIEAGIILFGNFFGYILTSLAYRFFAYTCYPERLETCTKDFVKSIENSDFLEQAFQNERFWKVVRGYFLWVATTLAKNTQDLRKTFQDSTKFLDDIDADQLSLGKRRLTWFSQQLSTPSLFVGWLLVVATTLIFVFSTLPPFGTQWELWNDSTSEICELLMNLLNMVGAFYFLAFAFNEDSTLLEPLLFGIFKKQREEAQQMALKPALEFSNHPINMVSTPEIFNAPWSKIIQPHTSQTLLSSADTLLQFSPIDGGKWDFVPEEEYQVITQDGNDLKSIEPRPKIDIAKFTTANSISVTNNTTDDSLVQYYAMRLSMKVNKCTPFALACILQSIEFRSEDSAVKSALVLEKGTIEDERNLPIEYGVFEVKTRPQDFMPATVTKSICLSQESADTGEYRIVELACQHKPESGSSNNASDLETAGMYLPGTARLASGSLRLFQSLISDDKEIGQYPLFMARVKSDNVNIDDAYAEVDFFLATDTEEWMPDSVVVEELNSIAKEICDAFNGDQFENTGTKAEVEKEILNEIFCEVAASSDVGTCTWDYISRLPKMKKYYAPVMGDDFRHKIWKLALERKPPATITHDVPHLSGSDHPLNFMSSTLESMLQVGSSDSSYCPKRDVNIALAFLKTDGWKQARRNPNLKRHRFLPCTFSYTTHVSASQSTNDLGDRLHPFALALLLRSEEFKRESAQLKEFEEIKKFSDSCSVFYQREKLGKLLAARDSMFVSLIFDEDASGHQRSNLDEPQNILLLEWGLETDYDGKPPPDEKKIVETRPFTLWQISGKDGELDVTLTVIADPGGTLNKRWLKFAIEKGVKSSIVKGIKELNDVLISDEGAEGLAQIEEEVEKEVFGGIKAEMTPAQKYFFEQFESR